MKTYTICLVGLEEKRVVVVGGGKVAARKARGLLEAGARVLVISPELSPEMQTLVESAQVDTLQRTYQQGDLQGAFLVIAATDEEQVNQAVWQEASQAGCLVNVADDPAHSNFITPATVRRGEITLAVSSGGSSPALARRLREQLETYFGPEYGDYAALLAELRSELKARFEQREARMAAASQLVDSDLYEVLASQGYAAAREYANNFLKELWRSATNES